MVKSSGRTPSGPAPLSVWPVAAGGITGILVGVFFGDYAHFLRPVGNVYVMLLEVAVYPYLICSLMHGLGSLAPAQAWRLFCSGWKFYVALWLITFGLLILLAKGIPQALATSWVADRAVKDAPGLLDILIPSDPFTALSRNYVPAVVLFCLFYGVALQHVPEKAALLSILEGIRLASLKFWNAVVRFAPLAVFALFADLAGSIRLKAMEEVALFFFLFCGRVASDLLDHPGMHRGVRAPPAKRGAARDEIRVFDRRGNNAFGFRAALYLFRHPASGPSLRRR